MQYLGHVIQPQKDKVQAVLDCPRPWTKKDVLGLVGWYRRFVSDMARRAGWTSHGNQGPHMYSEGRSRSRPSRT